MRVSMGPGLFPANAFLLPLWHPSELLPRGFLGVDVATQVPRNNFFFYLKDCCQEVYTNDLRIK